MATLVSNPQPESYAKFLDAVRQRAELDDADFPAISRRLHQYTAAELVGKAKWHSNCHVHNAINLRMCVMNVNNTLVIFI